LVTVRYETVSDREAVFRVEAAAFGEETEARLVDQLRDNGHSILSLIAEDGEEVVGHLMFSPMTIQGPEVSWDAVCLAPLAVVPSRQRTGVGGQLMRAGIAELRERGLRAVILLGHPEYYPRFGFRPAREFGLHFQDDRDAFMALELYPGALDGISGDVKFSPEFDPFV
jgi:putative acetyltransferase